MEAQSAKGKERGAQSTGTRVEVGGQRSEVRGQKTEDRGQKTDNRKPNFFVRNSIFVIRFSAVLRSRLQRDSFFFYTLKLFPFPHSAFTLPISLKPYT